MSELRNVKDMMSPTFLVEHIGPGMKVGDG